MHRWDAGSVASHREAWPRAYDGRQHVPLGRLPTLGCRWALAAGRSALRADARHVLAAARRLDYMKVELYPVFELCEYVG
jgi:hypothetical protein